MLCLLVLCNVESLPLIIRWSFFWPNNDEELNRVWNTPPTPHSPIKGRFTHIIYRWFNRTTRSLATSCRTHWQWEDIASVCLGETPKGAGRDVCVCVWAFFADNDAVCMCLWRKMLRSVFVLVSSRLSHAWWDWHVHVGFALSKVKHHKHRPLQEVDWRHREGWCARGQDYWFLLMYRWSLTWQCCRNICFCLNHHLPNHTCFGVIQESVTHSSEGKKSESFVRNILSNFGKSFVSGCYKWIISLLCTLKKNSVQQTWKFKFLAKVYNPCVVPASPDCCPPHIAHPVLLRTHIAIDKWAALADVFVTAAVWVFPWAHLTPLPLTRPERGCCCWGDGGGTLGSSAARVKLSQCGCGGRLRVGGALPLCDERSHESPSQLL